MNKEGNPETKTRWIRFRKSIRRNGITVILGVFAIWQAFVIHGQLTVMRIDERAWIVVTKKEKTSIEFDPLPTGTLIVTNTGKTPARHVLGNFIIEIVKNGDSPRFRPPAGISPSALIRGTLSPHQYQEIPVERDRLKSDGTIEPDMTTDSEKAALKNGKAWIAIHGVVLYEDVFKVQHWVNFCGFASPAHHADAEVCATYNDEDFN